MVASNVTFKVFEGTIKIKIARENILTNSPKNAKMASMKATIEIKTRRLPATFKAKEMASVAPAETASNCGGRNEGRKGRNEGSEGGRKGKKEGREEGRNQGQ